MSIQDEHHFVPRFHLRNFATDAHGKRRHICLVNIATGQHVFGASIRKQCRRRHLYGKDGEIERALAWIEDRTAPTVRHVIEASAPPPRHEVIRLAHYLMALHGRSPLARDLYNHRVDEFVKAAALTRPDVQHTRKDLDVVTVGYPPEDAMVLSLAQAEEHAPVLYDLRLAVLTNNTSTDFVLGDAPVVLHNQWAYRLRSEVPAIGLASAGLMIFSPVSPRRTLLLYDADVYRLHHDGARVEVVDDADVVQLNTLQRCNASEVVYYSRPESKEHVDGLDASVWRAPRDRVVVRYRQQTDEQPGLVAHEVRPIPLQLRLRCVAFSESANRVPVSKRCWALRGRAAQVADAIKQGRKR